jgi:hypothetical protein
MGTRLSLTIIVRLFRNATRICEWSFAQSFSVISGYLYDELATIICILATNNSRYQCIFKRTSFHKLGILYLTTPYYTEPCQSTVVYFYTKLASQGNGFKF